MLDDQFDQSLKTRYVRLIKRMTWSLTPFLVAQVPLTSVGMASREQDHVESCQQTNE